MKALLLAGGKGTRLKPLTNNLPKPMVPILGIPLLKRTLLNLKQYGIDDIILSICYKPTEIFSYFGDGRDLGIKITYVEEDIPLGTGGAIKNAEIYLDDTFLVLNSDIVSDINFGNILKYHKIKHAFATIALTPVPDPTQYGVVELNNGYITSFKEKPKADEVTSNLINAGIYVFEPEIFNEIPDNMVVSIEKDIYPVLIENGNKLAGFCDSFYWMDIGTPEKYMQVHYDILDHKYRVNTPMQNIFYDVEFSESLSVSAGSKIIQPVSIGKNVNIASNAVVGPYAVIGDNVKIGPGTSISNSIVWNNVTVGKSTSINNTIVGSNCEIGNTKTICDSVFVKGSEEPMAI